MEKKQSVIPRLFGLGALAGSALALSGCLATTPQMGGGSKGAITGAAGGATAENANSQLERCDQALGTLGIVEDQSSSWFQHLRNYKLGSTVPVLRMMVQQSNCFVIVERGAGMASMNYERQLQQSGEMRAGSNFQRGQMVAADYTMSPSVTFSQNTGGLNAGLAGLHRNLGVLSSVAGGMKTNEASTMLVMIDNRSGVQLAAAEGSARNMDFNVLGGLVGGSGAGSVGGYGSTPEGQIILTAFADSYNQLVRAVRNYRAQTVRGGLGTGGGLGVSGGSTPASQQVDAPVRRK